MFRVLDENLDPISNIYQTTLHDCIYGTFVFTETFEKDSFLFAFHSGEEADFKNQYEGSNMETWTWIVKASYDSYSLDLVLEEPEDQSLLVINEQATYIIELAKNHLLISVYQTDLFVAKDWTIIHHV